MFQSLKDYFSPPKWDPTKAKVHLKLAISRLKLQSTKKQNSDQLGRREVAQLLREGKEIQARVRVETMIREEKMVSAHSQLVVICEHVLARFDAMNLTSHPPPDLQGALCSLVYASPRVDIIEFRQFVANISIKYGKEFVDDALANRYSSVNDKVIENLSVQRPPRVVVTKYLTEIAQAANVKWDPPVEDEIITEADSGDEQLDPTSDDGDIGDNDDGTLIDDPDLQKELESYGDDGAAASVVVPAPNFVPAANFGPAQSSAIPPQGQFSIPTMQFSSPAPTSPIFHSMSPHSTVPAPNFNSPGLTATSPVSPTFRQPPQQLTSPTARPIGARGPRTSPAGVAKPKLPAPAPLNNSDDGDAMFLELDLPTVSKSAPHHGFNGGDDDDNSGDLLNQLPNVPPGPKPANSSAGSGGLSSSEAVLSRPRPSPGAPSASSFLDDDDLMRRFQALKDNK